MKEDTLLVLAVSNEVARKLAIMARAANRSGEEFVKILIEHEWVRVARFEDGGGNVGAGVRLTPEGTKTRAGMLTVSKKPKKRDATFESMKKDLDRAMSKAARSARVSENVSVRVSGFDSEKKRKR